MNPRENGIIYKRKNKMDETTIILRNQIIIMESLYRCLEGLSTHNGATWPDERRRLRESWSITRQTIRERDAKIISKKKKGKK